MKKHLIAGLGNPGRKYEKTRHNAGFLVIDRFAQESGLIFREEKRPPRYLIAEGKLFGGRLFLIKPLEYMNRSGGPVAKVASYFRIKSEDILVVHDDLDIALGRIKFVRSGGHGGHNGIRNIIEALGTKDFPRLKIGIGRPPKEMPADRYVLNRFSSEELIIMEKVIETASEGIAHFLKNGIESAMNKYNGIEVAYK